MSLQNGPDGEDEGNGKGTVFVSHSRDRLAGKRKHGTEKEQRAGAALFDVIAGRPKEVERYRGLFIGAVLHIRPQVIHSAQRFCTCR